MKSILKLTPALLLSLFLISCDEDVKEKPIATIQFATSEQTVSENGGVGTIAITFDKPAAQEGYVYLQFNSQLAQYFTSSAPAQNGLITLAVNKNDNGVELSITPLNNTEYNGTQTITFQISAASTGLQAGQQKTFTLKIQDDEDPLPPNSYATFIASNVDLDENITQAHVVRLQITDYPTANGTIVLGAASANAVYGTHYTTEPAFVNGELTLQVQPGTSEVSFTVLSVNDDIISGHRELTFAIKSTTGNIFKGTTSEDNLVIKDDELKGMPQGFEIGTLTGWGMKKTFEYNADGSVSKVHWENRTPYLTSGTDTYYYNDQKQLTRINERAEMDRYYIYENNRIVKEEKIDFGVLKRYTEYAYDDAGNVEGYRVFYRQPDGSYALSTIVVLLYYTDGNLYKKLMYTPNADPNAEPYLASVTTIESYREEPNHFPVIEVLPNLNTQKKLPAQYRHEVPGHDLLYNFTYQFTPDGKVSSRTATSGSTSETAVYRYY